MNQETLRKLHEMKLHGMAKSFESQLASAAMGHLSFEQRLGMMVDHESTWRENRRMTRLLQLARLRENACVEDIDFSPTRGLDRGELMSLTQGHWITQRHNLIITGPTGSGKTWLACALGHQTCRQGMSVSFLRLPLLLEDLAISHSDGSFRKRLMQLEKVELLILDDFGMATLNALGRNDLLEVIEGRCGKRSTVITSQLPVDRWHDYLSGGNPTVADAILDRLVGCSQRLTLRGDSLRKPMI